MCVRVCALVGWRCIRNPLFVIFEEKNVQSQELRKMFRTKESETPMSVTRDFVLLWVSKASSNLHIQLYVKVTTLQLHGKQDLLKQ